MCIFGLLMNTGAVEFLVLFSRDEIPVRTQARYSHNTPFHFNTQYSVRGSDSWEDRPFTPSTLRPDGVLAPLDLHGGTWLGFNTITGRFVCLTNVDDLVDDHRDQSIRHLPRGMLVLNLLRSPTATLPSPEELPKYRGFHLLLAETFKASCEAQLITNRPYNAPLSPIPFKNGPYVISNGRTEQPEWPKVAFFREEMKRKLMTPNISKEELIEGAKAILLETPDFDASLTPTFDSFFPGEYKSPEELRACQSVRVVFPSWATRCQTIVLKMKGENTMTILENPFDSNQEPTKWTSFAVPCPTPAPPH